MRPTVGFALCGSFCTLRKAIDALRALTAQYTVVPIFSDAAWETDTRFGASADFRAEVTALCGTEQIKLLSQRLLEKIFYRFDSNLGVVEG